MPLGICTHSIPVQFVDASDILNHLMNIMNQKSALPMSYDFGSRSTRKRNHWTSQRHSLDHHHAKWLFPLNRVQQTTGATQQVDLLLHIDRANILDVLIIKLWL